jgi:pyruvate/2-oxoglutarate dehydrogenase complex dihydrolipoamide dehydrogenase (E3) component
MSRFDVIIIGAGPAGPPLVSRLTGAGMTVAMVERRLFGGTCVNTSRMPTKTLIANAFAAHVARRSADYGIVSDGAIHVDILALDRSPKYLVIVGGERIGLGRARVHSPTRRGRHRRR